MGGPPAFARGGAGRAAPAAPPPPAPGGGGGLFDRAKKALGLSKEQSKQDDGYAPAAEAKARAAAPSMDLQEDEAAAPVRADAGEDIGGMFARQLASGLWEGGDGSDAGRLAATTACLARCVREGIDSSNPIYGAQVTKAVDALSTVAEALAQKGESDAEVIRALLAMVAVSSGKRARGRVVAIAGAARSAAVKAVVADLGSQDAAKKRLG